MVITNIVKKLPWKGSNGKMDKKKIDTVVVHHDGVVAPATYDDMKRIQSEAAYHVAKGWNHISYHFQISNDGTVYQCLPEDEIGYHAGNYFVNKRSVAICLHGNFQVQNPTPKQVKALSELCLYLFTERPDLPLVVKKSLKMHKEVRLLPTSCPGKNLYPIVDTIRR